MPGRKLLVNLDAMIPRADFAVIEGDAPNNAQIQTIAVRDLQNDSPLLPNLRKPDFQRETNHWTPAQVASLIDCFLHGDLIPSVILWNSPSHVFVIDGGHRLSALRAWIEDDYGDGPVSQEFFKYQITDVQKRAAAATRRLIDKEIGSWQHWKAKNQQTNLPESERSFAKGLSTRAIQVQWVSGDADKAEASFFKINTQGTPLDDIEQLLITNRRKPGAIAARSIIRAGTGNKYWSQFTEENQKHIEEKAKALFQILFEPEVDTPIKTLDLPLGGVAGVRTSLSLLTDFLLIAERNQDGKPAAIKDEADDADGSGTIRILDKALAVASRITGNKDGSLGLHPAVYFYGPSGRHTAPLFMGVATLISRKLVNNDDAFFKKFTNSRGKFEDFIVENKQLIAAIIQQTRSGKRYDTIAGLFDFIIRKIAAGAEPTE